MKKYLIIIIALLIMNIDNVKAETYKPIFQSRATNVRAYNNGSSTAEDLSNSYTSYNINGQTFYKYTSNRANYMFYYNLYGNTNIETGYYDIEFKFYGEVDYNFALDTTYSIGTSTGSNYTHICNVESVEFGNATNMSGNDSLNGTEFGIQIVSCKNIYIDKSFPYIYIRAYSNYIGGSTGTVNTIVAMGPLGMYPIQNTAKEIIEANSNEEIPEAPTGEEADQLEEIETNLIENNKFDSNTMNIQIDSNSSNWIWTKVTALIQTNAKIFGMIITILSIGIIKLIFDR